MFVPLLLAAATCFVWALAIVDAVQAARRLRSRFNHPTSRGTR